MNKRIFSIIVLILVISLPLTSAAGEFNGSKTFVSAIIDAYECVDNSDCHRVMIKDIDCPRFLTVNLKKNIIIGTMSDQSTRDVEIKSSEHINDNLVLQGVQKGRVWCLIISEETGKITLNVASQREVYTFFGDSFVP